jgi:hypothetical protein
VYAAVVRRQASTHQHMCVHGPQINHISSIAVMLAVDWPVWSLAFPRFRSVIGPLTTSTITAEELELANRPTGQRSRIPPPEYSTGWAVPETVC